MHNALNLLTISALCAKLKERAERWRIVMTPEELRNIGEKLYGNWGWQTRMAETLKVDSSTVRRWLSGKVVIPGPAEVALELLLKVQTKEDTSGI